MMWLQYDKFDHEYIYCLSLACVHFQDQLLSVWNYNPAFIAGSKNFQTSSFVEHVWSDMHLYAMLLFQKS